jgi:hypothetical protein
MHSGLKVFFAAAIVWASSSARAADGARSSEKTTWHGYDRCDFIMTMPPGPSHR